MHTEITIFDKPIERIRTMCQLMGLGADFDRKLPELETHLEGLVAEGETSEERLTVSGLSFVKQAPSECYETPEKRRQEISSGSFQAGSGAQLSSLISFT
jgi:hypothetical protein